jgi:hypothetical protein
MTSKTSVTLSIAVSCLLAFGATCHADGAGNVPLVIRSFMAAKSHPDVTLFRLAPSGEPTLSNGFHNMRIEEVIQLSATDAAQVTDALTSRATYTASHLGCVADGFGLRLERKGERLDLLIDVACYHVFDAETRTELGLLSDSGNAFFKLLIAKPGTSR